MKYRYLFVLLLSFFGLNTFAQKAKPAPKMIAPVLKSIRWISFEEAVALSNKEPRKLIVDVYTNWCGWCKKMDATTYEDPGIIDYINKKYYAVRLNAEIRDTIRFKPARPAATAASQYKSFAYNPEYKANELAVSLLGGKMGYPTTVFMDENYGIIQPVSGYIDTNSLGMILTFLGEDCYKDGVKWEEYQKQFKGIEK